LITNSPDEVREFLFEHGRVIYKSTSSIRSIVRELEGCDLDKLDRVRNLPTQFQAFVPGTNIRVHVVGQDVFATRIESESTDYRYAGRDGNDVTMRAVELPTEIRERCVELSRTLDLPLCGIDLKLTPDGSYYCFEVNPSPAYTYYEEQTGQPIAEAIVSYLANGM
jgi:glutathione synthase/RimK-type ligase-like ATP-grasp enzyme